MATTVGSGLGSSLGTVVETVYGAGGVPDRWVEYGNHSIEWKPKRVNGSGLANGNLVQRRSQRVTTTSTVDGTVKTQAFYKGMGQWFGALMGSLAVAPVQQGATTAYKQTHALANTYGQSLAVQGGFPELGGLIVPRNWAGLKVVKGEFACKVDEILECSFDVDGRSEDTAAGRADTAGTTSGSPTVTDVSITVHDNGAPVSGTGIPAGSYVWGAVPGASFTLSTSPTSLVSVNATATGSPAITVGTAYATPTYQTANDVFAFHQANLQMGVYGSETTVEGIRSVTLTIDRPYMKSSFYQDGSGGLKQQQVLNGWTKITVAMESDYISDPAFVAQFVNDNAQSFIWTFTSSVNAGAGYPFSLSFAVPSLSWDQGAPSVAGPEVIQPKLSLTGLYDDTHTPATITAISTDPTL
jgi:hypothetical protein